MLSQSIMSDTKLDRTLARRKRIKAALWGILILVLYMAAQNAMAGAAI